MAGKDQDPTYGLETADLVQGTRQHQDLLVRGPNNAGTRRKWTNQCRKERKSQIMDGQTMNPKLTNLERRIPCRAITGAIPRLVKRNRRESPEGRRLSKREKAESKSFNRLEQGKTGMIHQNLMALQNLIKDHCAMIPQTRTLMRGQVGDLAEVLAGK
jgi:hypothetical protein